MEPQGKEGAERPRARGEERRSQSRHAPSFQFYWRDWLASPEVRALDRDGRGALLDIICFTQGTKAPGVMTEEQARVWAAYSPEEWVTRRESLRACFRVRADGMWVQERTRREHLARRNRFQRARQGAKEAARKRWRDRDMNAARMVSGMRSASSKTPPSLLLPPLLVKDEIIAVPSSDRRSDGTAPLLAGGAQVAGAAPVGELLGRVMARLAPEEGGP